MALFFDPVVEKIVGLAAQQIKDANDKGGKDMVSVGIAPLRLPIWKGIDHGLLENRKSYLLGDSVNQSTCAIN